MQGKKKGYNLKEGFRVACHWDLVRLVVITDGFCQEAAGSPNTKEEVKSLRKDDKSSNATSTRSTLLRLNEEKLRWTEVTSKKVD
jgi:hypothetical protein